MASGNIASSDLLWLLTKKHTSFQHKRVGTPLVFSAEKGNLKNINAHKFSGLANQKTFHVQPRASGNGVTLITRDENASPFAVASAYKKKSVKGTSGRKVAGRVSKTSGSSQGRLDLRDVAQARASAVLKAQGEARAAQRTRSPRGNKKVIEVIEA